MACNAHDNAHDNATITIPSVSASESVLVEPVVVYQERTQVVDAGEGATAATRAASGAKRGRGAAADAVVDTSDDADALRGDVTANGYYRRTQGGDA